MKKQILFLILMLGIALNINAQGPIQPYVEDQYEISQVESFALSNSSLSKSWRDEAISIINDGLTLAGIDMELDERHISWIFNHVEYEFVDLPKGYTNSYRSENGGSVKFTDKTKEVRRIKVGVFKYKNLRIVLFKAACMNLLKIQPQTVVEQNNPAVSPTQSQLPVIPVNQEDSPVLPKNIGELRTAILNTPTPVQQPVIPSVKRNWKPVIWIAGVAVTAGLSYLAYTLLKSKPTTPGGGSPVDPTGGDVGGPVDPTGGQVGP